MSFSSKPSTFVNLNLNVICFRALFDYYSNVALARGLNQSMCFFNSVVFENMSRANHLTATAIAIITLSLVQATYGRTCTDLESPMPVDCTKM